MGIGLSADLGSVAKFLLDLRQGVALSAVEDEVMHIASVRNSEQLQALLWNFPSLSKLIDFPKLSNAAMRASHGDQPDLRLASIEASHTTAGS